ncbi:hypothetical protein HDE_07621 [Halotydeus destructor]|nr:hypothetical protein HDE_07621 [Halotydeus destructor]
MADNERQMPLRIKLRIIWICLCIIGNTFQAYILVKAYLAREISTQVKIHFPEVFEPPAASLCFSLISMVKLDIALTRWPDLETKMAGILAQFNTPNGTSFEEAIAKSSFAAKLSMSQFVFNNLQVKDAFAITYRPQDLFSHCSIIRDTDYAPAEAACEEFYDITESFKSTLKCFTFKLKHRLFYDYLTLQRLKQFPGRTSVIWMTNTTENLTTDMTIFYHLRHTYSREGFSRSLLVSPMELFTVSYVTIETELLPPPYATNCRNYTRSGFVDRGDCFESCFTKESLEKLGKLAPGPNILRDDFSLERLLDVETVRNDPSLDATVRTMNADCNKLCSQPNCRERYHIPQLMSTTEYPVPALQTITEQEPKFSTTNFPKLDWIESITDLGSTLGFWMGFTGLTVFDLFWTTYSFRQRRTLSLRVVQVSARPRPRAAARRPLTHGERPLALEPRRHTSYRSRVTTTAF